MRARNSTNAVQNSHHELFYEARLASAPRSRTGTQRRKNSQKVSHRQIIVDPKWCQMSPIPNLYCVGPLRKSNFTDFYLIPKRHLSFFQYVQYNIKALTNLLSPRSNAVKVWNLAHLTSFWVYNDLPVRNLLELFSSLSSSSRPGCAPKNHCRSKQ